MRVLHVMPSFYPALVYGGPIISVFALCRELGRLGHEIRVLTSNANGTSRVLEVDPDREVDIAPGVRARYCRRTWPEAVAPSLVSALPAYVRWADVVHLTSVYSFPTIPALAIAAVAGRPMVWSPRGALVRWAVSRRTLEKRLFESLCRLVAPRRLVLHATSREEASDSATRFPYFSSRVIPNGVDVPPVIERTACEDRLRLLFLGRLHPVKAVENLIDAATAIVTGRLRIALTIAGAGEPGYEEALRQRAKRCGLEDVVSFVGEVKNEAKRALMAGADLLVLPSHSENFGMVVAEALAHGVPVIASTGTPWRRVEEVGCGLWVENRPESLAAAVRRLASMPLQEMGSRGREWMVREFGWQQRARQMADAYAALLGGAHCEAA